MRSFDRNSFLFWGALITMLGVGALTTAARADNIDPGVVSQVNFERYAGFWYEIAHTPNDFQNGCARSTATYTLLVDESVGLKNTCYPAKGPERSIEGRAQKVDVSVPAKLLVTFQTGQVGDYWITRLDGDYQWAVVSAPGKKVTFILSRTPTMEAQVLQSLLLDLRADGYDTESFVYDAAPLPLSGPVK